MIDHDGDMIDGRFRLSSDAAVLELDYDVMKTYFNDDTLPGIWITEPVQDEDGNYLGRTRLMLYPLEDTDTDGADALYYGGGYYDEAMSYTAAADHEKRIDCFKAAEILYRHSAGRGNPLANLCLGYVYSYNRCEGDYWQGPTSLDESRPYPYKERAFECFFRAAYADVAEACYKLGDLYNRGVGCDPDAAQAFHWYMRAFELSTHERPVIMGSVALRLADCFEEGSGCEQSFEKALEWYRRAVAALEVAVEGGETWYEKPLSSARDGIKRCEQELAL